MKITLSTRSNISKSLVLSIFDNDEVSKSMEKEVRDFTKMDRGYFYDDDSDWEIQRGMGTTIFL